MIKNCDGCEWEFRKVCEFVRAGNHLAVYEDNDTLSSDKVHFNLIIVDDSGCLVAW